MSVVRFPNKPRSSPPAISQSFRGRPSRQSDYSLRALPHDRSRAEAFCGTITKRQILARGLGTQTRPRCEELLILFQTTPALLGVVHSESMIVEPHGSCSRQYGPFFRLAAYLSLLITPSAFGQISANSGNTPGRAAIIVDGSKYPLSASGLQDAVSTCIASSSCAGVNVPYLNAVTVPSTIVLSRAITLWLGNVHLTLTGNPGIKMTAAGASLQCSGRRLSILTAGTVGDLIQTNAGAERVEHCELEGANLASIAIHITHGSSQRFIDIFCSGTAAPCIQFEPGEGGQSVTANSLLESNAEAIPSIRINGNDGCGSGKAVPREFTNIQTGGSMVDLQGGGDVLIENGVFGGVTMTSAACKVIMYGNRFLNKGVTIAGVNQVFVANAVAGQITLDTSLYESAIGPNVSVGGYKYNVRSNANNAIVDSNNSPLPLKRLGICTQTLEGFTHAVNDSSTNTWGAVITGNGTNHVLAYCDGANWTVTGR